MAEPVSPPYAHNLVSSLYAMKGMIESFFLNREEGFFQYDEEILERAEEVLKKASKQAEAAIQMAKKLNQVLETKARASDAKASLKEVWNSVKGILEKEFPIPQIEILERIPSDFPSLRCEPEDLREILYHLSQNAFQALKEKGKLVIRAQISFSTKEEPWGEIQLADTGPGIPDSKLPRLFLPFYTTKPWQEGTGLGLYLTQQLVLRNQGRITVSSFPGSGTTFTLEFPLEKSLPIKA